MLWCWNSSILFLHHPTSSPASFSYHSQCFIVLPSPSGLPPWATMGRRRFMRRSTTARRASMSSTVTCTAWGRIPLWRPRLRCLAVDGRSWEILGVPMESLWLGCDGNFLAKKNGDLALRAMGIMGSHRHICAIFLPGTVVDAFYHQAALEAERQGVPQVQRDLHANFKLLPTAARYAVSKDLGRIPCTNDIYLCCAMPWPSVHGNPHLWIEKHHVCLSFSAQIKSTRSLKGISYIPKLKLHPSNIFFPFLSMSFLWTATFPPGSPGPQPRPVVVRSWSVSRLRAAARCVRHEFGRSAAVPMAAWGSRALPAWAFQGRHEFMEGTAKFGVIDDCSRNMVNIGETWFEPWTILWLLWMRRFKCWLSRSKWQIFQGPISNLGSHDSSVTFRSWKQLGTQRSRIYLKNSRKTLCRLSTHVGFLTQVLLESCFQDHYFSPKYAWVRPVSAQWFPTHLPGWWFQIFVCVCRFFIASWDLKRPKEFFGLKLIETTWNHCPVCHDRFQRPRSCSLPCQRWALLTAGSEGVGG